MEAEALKALALALNVARSFKVSLQVKYLPNTDANSHNGICLVTICYRY